MDPDAELDAALGLHAGVAVDQAGLHLNRAAHSIYNAAKLDDDAVPGALDDAAVMGGDGGVDEVATEAPQARKGAVLVSPGEPAVTDDIGHQDCCEFPGLGHWTLGPSSNLTRSPTQSCRKALKDAFIASLAAAAEAQGKTPTRQAAEGRHRTCQGHQPHRYPDRPVEREGRLYSRGMLERRSGAKVRTVVNEALPRVAGARSIVVDSLAIPAHESCAGVLWGEIHDLSTPLAASMASMRSVSISVEK